MLTSRRNTTIHAQSFVVRKDKDLMTPTVTQAFSIIYCTNNIILSLSMNIQYIHLYNYYAYAIHVGGTCIT